MTPPRIHLSFAGNGRVVLLTPSTVRQAFFRFVDVNRLTARRIHRFDSPRDANGRFATTTLDRLFRRGPLVFAEGLTRHRAWQLSRRKTCRWRPWPWNDWQVHKPLAATGVSRGRAEPPYLTHSEIQRIEREMNRMLLDEDAALVPGESRLEQGVVPGSGDSSSIRRALFVVRYGMVFEVAPLRRDTLLQGSLRDIVIEDDNRSLDVVRYQGVRTDRRSGAVLMRLAHRLDLARTWEIPWRQFAPPRLFSIRRVAPWEGFCFSEFSAIAGGD